MSVNETNSGNGLETGANSFSSLPSGISDTNRDLFGQPLSKAPNALTSIPTHPLLESDGLNTEASHDSSISAAQAKARSGDSLVYGDEFESGIPPIDFAARQIGKVLEVIDKTVEESTPSVRQFISEKAARLSEATHDGVDTARRNWNAPDNEIRGALTDRIQRGVGFLKKWAVNLSENRDVRELMDNTIIAGRNLAEKTGDVIQNAQVATESWLDRAYNETCAENFLPSGQLSGRDRLAHSFVGVIDNGFNAQDHGTQVTKVIQQVGHQFPDWLADSVGSGTWSKSLVNFVDAAKASERSNAVINLSFDLTQINPDGSVSTRFELTAEEREALKYAQANGVLVVVSAGNQSGAMSALGQASQDFGNVIAVGAAKGGQRAEYSSYSAGLDFVASGQGKGEVEGTSLAAARVTGSIARIWDANPQFDYRRVTQTLESTAIDLQQSGWDHETGFGRLNTSAAIALAEGLASQPQNPVQANQSNPDLHNATFERESSAWQGLNGAIPSERPNRVLEGDGIQSEPASNIASPPSGLSSLDRLLKYESGVPLQYDEQVKQWQQRMSDRGWNITADGLYGSQSAQIARQFQQEKGLAVDGIVGSDTWAATFDGNTATNSPPSGLSSLDRLLKYEPGMPLQYDEQVKQWQQRMSDRGWNITADGLYGSQSDQIARQFQQEKGLAVDGIVGSDTWAATFDGNTAIGSFIPALPNTSGIPGSSLGGSAQQMLDVARSFIGVREQGGDNRGAQVQAFQRAVGGVAAGEAWCMGFAQYSIKAAEGATQSDSPVVQSEGCVDVWNRSPASLRHSRPEVGSLVIWQDRGNTTGHVGIVESVNSDGSFTTIEGNTTDDRGTGAEGVYRRHRTMSNTDKRVILGFLKVFPDDVSADTGYNEGLSSSFSTGSSLSDHSFKYEPGVPLTHDPAVAQWQQHMKNQGYDIAVDGLYGSQSEQVARQFQQEQGLMVDGIVGPNTQEAVRNVDPQLSQAEGLSLIPGIGDVFNKPPASLGFSEDVTLNGEPKPMSLKRYSEDGSLQAIDPNQETLVAIHGWDSDAGDENIREMAKVVSSQGEGVQVLILDWGSAASAPLPHFAANWIAPVGEWAHDKLKQLGIDPDKTTLVGNSLGAYVGAELAAQLGNDAELAKRFGDNKVKNLVALDPAAPGSNAISGYDVDGRTWERDLPKAFRDVAKNSLSFVAADNGIFGWGGALGDNDQAATADNSFVIEFPEGDGRDAHTLVAAVFIDALEDGYLTVPKLTLPDQLDNWYGHSGDRQNDSANSNAHEGRISANVNGEIIEMVRVVDGSGGELPAWS